MTVALSVKVHDGVVLAADSASTLFAPEGVVNVYNHANKVFNIVKGHSIGAITWGSGSIGNSSIETLVKDLRARLSGVQRGPDDEDWTLPQDYTIDGVAHRLRQFFFEEKYLPLYQETESKPDLGFLVAGYSSNAESPEIWRVQIMGGECGAPTLVRTKEDGGLDWNGQIDAITRLVKGHDPRLPQVLHQLGVPDEDLLLAMTRIREALETLIAPLAMPIQDAISLAEFLVETTIKWHTFIPGAPTVGGPVEIATITKHEGYKWVRRKHYYSLDLNPPQV